ncbi:hypothetical protein ACKLNO_02120 [Neisseriaceae bacterium B1]
MNHQAEIIEFSYSFWRSSLKLLPAIFVCALLSIGLFYLVPSATRDVVFYAIQAVLLLCVAVLLLFWLVCIFGKPLLVIQSENIMIRYAFRRPKIITWQQIERIELATQRLYLWSRNTVFLHFRADIHAAPYDMRHDVVRLNLSADMLKGGAAKVAQQLNHYWRLYR